LQPDYAHQALGPSIRLDLAYLKDRKNPIKKSVLKSYLTRLNLADVLKYVQLPHFEVEDDEKKPPKTTPTTNGNMVQKQAVIAANRGPPSNCETIFDLLQEVGKDMESKSKVHSILHIIVDDTCGSQDKHYAPHTNAAIEACLKPFAGTIERWAWKKPDICLDTVFKVAPKLRRIYLYSSGNNMVLRGWAHPNDGLAKFKEVCPLIYT